MANNDTARSWKNENPPATPTSPASPRAMPLSPAPTPLATILKQESVTSSNSQPLTKAPSSASLERVITSSKMAALQSRRGSGSSLAHLRNSLLADENPRRGSAVGNYGLPVPQHSAKLGGSSLFLHHSRAGSVESSGRNSPVLGWGENGQARKVNGSENAAQRVKTFTNIYDANQNQKKEEINCMKSLLKILTFGLSGDPEGPGCCAVLLVLASMLLCLALLPLSLFFCVKVVKEYERAVIFRLGRLRSGGAKGPGIFFIVPCIDSYKKLDLRTVSFDVPPQEILSRDSVTLSVDAVVYYRVSNPTMATNNVEDYRHSTHLLAATTLRNVIGTKCLAQVLSEREQISHYMETTLDEATDPWGVKVERVEIKDVRLPLQLQRAMAAEAEAAREARAKVIAAEGEKNAAVSLRSASDVISDNPAAMQLRYLQTLSSISAEKNSTIIFPLPMDILQAFSRK